MLKRIYIDNFRCFVNFELSVDSINLLLGPNGSGKSTVFDVLRNIQMFIGGDKADDIFKPDDLTRWQTSPIQTFGLEIEGNEGTYKYELTIKHDPARQHTRVNYEHLWLDGKPLLKFEAGQAQFYEDDHPTEPILFLPSDWSRSVIAILSTDYTPLDWFRERMKRFIIVQIDPMLMVGDSHREEAIPTAKMENFVSWYRYIYHTYQDNAAEIVAILREILDGFDDFKFIEVGEQRRFLALCFLSEHNGHKSEYLFTELSDGQRVFIVLYALIYYARSKDYTLCIDEPENFLALSEIQPWLILLYDLCEDGELQALLVSHHPELIDYLASPAGHWFDSESNRPVQAKRITEDIEGGIPISELVARGWLYD